MPGDTFDEFVEDYFAECDEHLSAIRRLLLDVAGRSPRAFERAEFAEMARRLETLRALSKIVGLVPAEELAKTLEEVFHGTTAAGTSVGKDVIDLFFAGVGLLDRSIQSKRGWHPVPDHRAFIAGVRDFMRRRREVYATAVVQSAPAPALLGDVEIDEDPRHDALVPSPRLHHERTSSGANVLHVDVARVDDLMHIIGELVVLRSRLDESLRRTSAGAGLDDLRNTNRALERQLRSLRDNVTRMRRVSIDVLFERIRFITRDLLHGSGRTVHLQCDGRGTAIDAVLVERLLEPLLHLVRRAALHGIEGRAERRARGKPPEGTIALRARTSGDRVVLEAEDDGVGGDIDGTSDRLGGTDERIDVVRSAITALGGELSISGDLGRGTTFTIELPIRDVVTDALLVTVGDQVMAIPLLSLREVMRLEPTMITSLLGAGMIAYRGSALPLLMLHRHFELSPPARPRSHVLVVEQRTHRLGLVVDDVIGIRVVVVRPLSDERWAAPGIAGATELADGRLAPIIDAAALMRRWRGVSFTATAGEVATPAVS